MCLVDIDGRGIVTSCSTPPQAGMVVRTNTKEVRDIRRINLELLLANHDRECTTCAESGACSLQNLARAMGVESIRFKPAHKPKPIDTSSQAIVRNPNKCVLCGDCVRFCDEIQSVGALDFAYRGAHAEVTPAFNRPIAEVDCVNCGQCSRVCPTGAITPHSDIEPVWDMLSTKGTTTVAQVAPAIRVALGEYFGMPEGTITTGKVAAALRRLGFARVYDTCFTADLTVLEEGHEFLGRVTASKNLPLFTSCCPAWVKFTEQYYPDLLVNLSTCRSPQQMFGSLARKVLPQQLGVQSGDLRVISIMPCTAKKFEAGRPEFRGDKGMPDVDVVLTSQELGRMIESAGIRFTDLPDEPFDAPFGIASGAGQIFGASGGVTEAVVRYAAEELTGAPLAVAPIVNEAAKGIREITVTLGGITVKAAVVYGLGNARRIARQVRDGKSPYQVIEVMACPGGCINGAGQPVTYDAAVVAKRGRSLYEIDASGTLRAAQHNPALKETYKQFLGEVGGPAAHHLLHTHYANRRRVRDGALHLHGTPESSVSVEVCVGTNCCLHGAHDLLRDLVKHIDAQQIGNRVEVKAAFCFERCSGASPVVRIGDKMMGGVKIDDIKRHIHKALMATSVERTPA
jgi:NADH-quinone oxidoreductase subunit G